MKDRMRAALALALWFAASPPGWAAEAKPDRRPSPGCDLAFSRLFPSGRPATFHPEPVARAFSTLLLFPWRRAREIWVEEYLALLKNQDLPTGRRFQNFLTRAVLAPRSQATDPAIRERELKRMGWRAVFFPLAYLDPLGFGEAAAVEAISKAKILLGRKPLERTLSIPASFTLSTGAGFAYYGHLSQRQDEARQQALASNQPGMAYLEDWAEAFGTPPDELIRAYNEHMAYLDQWLKEIPGGSDRMYPPRFYQFWLMGLLKDKKELSALEDILLDTLRESGKTQTTPSQEIRRRLETHPVFSAKSRWEKSLLAMALDPPLLVGRTQDLSWVKRVRRGEQGVYEAQVQPFADLTWLYGLEKSESFASLRSAIGEESAARSVALAYSQETAEGRDVLRKKREEWKRLRFPREKSYLADRIDTPGFVPFPLPWIDRAGNEVELTEEMDYWKLLVEHPVFHTLKKQWLAGKTDQEVMGDLRIQVFQLSLLYAMQEDSIDPSKSPLPSDPPLQDICTLEKNRLFREEVSRWQSSLGASVPPAGRGLCHYLSGIAAWRHQGLLQARWKEGRYADPESLRGAPEEWLRKQSRLCWMPPAEMTKALGVSQEILREKIRCLGD